MGNLLKITLCGLLLLLLFVNVFSLKNDKSNHFSLANLVALNTANAEDPNGDLLDHCSALWGSGCRSDNYGVHCISAGDC
jgi:hypothetical protein